LAARACYDPAAAASVFSKLGEVEARHGGNTVPKFLRTHPVSSDRIASIKKMLPRATALGEAAGCDGSLTRLQEFEDRLGRQLRPVEWGVVRASVDRGGVF
jgi:predicted Zn-dependent protease